MKTFWDLLDSDGVFVFDGAVGTRLYDKGIYINRSYDELNLTNPDLVREVHEEYVAAGTEIIEPNSLGATRHKLQPYGLENKIRQINVAAANMAREAAGDDIMVAGAIGPLGLRLEPFGPTSFDEAKDMFREQIEGLLEGGVDLFILETFSEFEAIEQAVRAVREISSLPIVAQMTIQMDGKTIFGTSPEDFTAKLDELDIEVIGLNCGMGPNHILNALEKMRKVTDKPLSAQPNAGLLRDVQRRQFYLGWPEYMAEFSRRFVQVGAKFVGGCCGTTPTHIKLIADAIRSISPRQAISEARKESTIKVTDLKPDGVE